MQINLLTSEEQADLSWPMRTFRSQRWRRVLKEWAEIGFMTHATNERKHESQQTAVSWLRLTRGCRLSIHAVWVQLIMTQELLDALERHASLCVGREDRGKKTMWVKKIPKLVIRTCFIMTNYVQCDSIKQKSSWGFKYSQGQLVYTKMISLCKKKICVKTCLWHIK